jgi:hypothetical protein
VVGSPPPSSSCHAEGRGFESLQPLPRRPAFKGLFRGRSRLVRLHPVGLIPDSRPGRSSADPRKTRCLQADSGSSEPKSFCGPAEGRVFCLPRPLARPLLQRDDPTDSGRGPWGPVRFQSGNSEVDLGPLRDLASDGPQSRELSHRTASEAAARCPSRGACAAAVTRGHLRGRRFPSASRRPRASGLGSSSSSRAGTRSSTMAASARAGEAGAAPRGIHARGASE